MKLNKTEIILFIIFLILMFLCFILNQKDVGYVFVFLIIFIITPKGSLKSATPIKLEFYPIEPDIFDLITEAPEWIKADLNIHEIKISQISLYLQLTLRDSLTLTNPFNENKKVSVSNLEKFKKYTKLGYYGFTTIDNSLESKYRTLLLFFELLQKCKFISNPSNATLDKIIPDLKIDTLPFSLSEEDDEEINIHQNDTIQEYLDTTTYKTDIQNKYFSITIKYPEFNESESWSFWEIQRADFSNSGCEEIFVLCHYHSAGTLNFYYPMLVRHIAGRYDTIDIKYSSSFIEKIVNFIMFDLFRYRLRMSIKIEKFKTHIKQKYLYGFLKK